MSLPLISRSPDLLRLRDEGYEVEVRAGYLVVTNVPYVAPDKLVKRGVLVSTLTLAGDRTARPDTHVVTFAGETPCDPEGNPLRKLINSSSRQILAPELEVNHTFSSKPVDGYPDYHAKMTTYIAMLGGPALAIDKSASAQTFRPIEAQPEFEPFRYTDTASSRAGIVQIGAKLRQKRIGIVGAGGTGGYILDLVAKTPVEEIHLFDGDVFLQHNAFRAPGAASLESLTTGLRKVEYFAAMYGVMRTGVIPHPYFVNDSNVDELCMMDFVFLTIDSGPAKRLIAQKLQESGVPFIDVGMGLSRTDDALVGIVRVTASTRARKAHFWQRVPFHDDTANLYSSNIQVADLNALNAALAVIKWKKFCGFYLDLEGEHHIAYTLDGNHMLNEEGA